VVIAQVLDGSAQEPRMGFDMQAGAEASVASAAGAASGLSRSLDDPQ
jgi:hypothetical protein